MQLTEVVRQIGHRCAGLENEERRDALLDDLRACGLRDGPDLQGVYDRWRTAWTNRYAPAAAQFAAFARPAVPQASPGTGAMLEHAEQRKGELLASALEDFDRRYPQSPVRVRAELNLRRLCFDYAQAEYLHERGKMSDERFAGYGWKLTDADVGRLLAAWESQERFLNARGRVAGKLPMLEYRPGEASG